MFRVKICGLTRPQDVRSAVQAGADAVGFQMSRGPRKITPAAAKRLAPARRPQQVINRRIVVTGKRRWINARRVTFKIDAGQVCT